MYKNLFLRKNNNMEILYSKNIEDKEILFKIKTPKEETSNGKQKIS